MFGALSDLGPAVGAGGAIFAAVGLFVRAIFRADARSDRASAAQVRQLEAELERARADLAIERALREKVEQHLRDLWTSAVRAHEEGQP